MTRRLFLSVLAFGVTSAPRFAAAHHSTAMFDQGARVTLTGSIKEFQWANPHAWIQVISPAADGTPVEWSIECGSPNTLSRQGWKPSVLKFGDKVSIVANPMKDGTHAGLLVTVTLADGRVLGPGANPPPAARS
ncbi:MAG: DUF6152 family protein [Vicinamibacterales bacterium]